MICLRPRCEGEWERPDLVCSLCGYDYSLAARTKAILDARAR